MAEKEKVKFHPEKCGLSVRGAEWTLWVRRVKTKDGRTMFIINPLEANYNPERQTFSYREMKRGIWVGKEEMDKIIVVLIQLTEENKQESS